MPTSVHIPEVLLKQADRRARALHISRNRLIVRALERELAEGSEWSAGFFERILDVERGTEEAVDEMLAAIHRARSSKAPPSISLPTLVGSAKA